MKTLFVNHSQQRCGVYQFGKRVYELAKLSNKVQYDYIEVESLQEFEAHVSDVDVILYNWYPVTMPWLSEEWVKSHPQYKHYFLFHDGNVRQNYDKYLFTGSEGKDTNFPVEKTHILPRPLFEFDVNHTSYDVFTVGSFGFGGWQKGFPQLVQLVNEQFEKAIINIQMPFAYFGDRYGTETRKIADACRKANANSNIVLNISHEFLSTEDTLKFLAGNTINIFLYKSQNQGLSSVIDYALSARRPIAIRNDSMFKHIYKPSIDAENFSLLEIASAGSGYVEELYNRWNPADFAGEMDKIYDIQ